MIHYMLDTETLSARSNPVIRSIAVIPFDPTGDGPLKSRAEWFDLTLKLEPQQKAGLYLDPRTIMWWMQQSKDARLRFTSGDETRPEQALDRFAAYIHGDAPIWAWGAASDIVWMNSLAAAFGYSEIYHRRVRCLRTLGALAGVRPEQFNHGTEHDPVDDCLAQIALCQHAYKKLGNLVV